MVTDAQENHVPFISLHPLNVLHEEPLAPLRGKEGVQPHIVFNGKTAAQGVLNIVGVVGPERDHPQRLSGRCLA